MSGDWIKMRIDLLDDPAVIGMACALGVDEYSIVGRLHKLWSWADKHCDNGHAKSVTFVWIDRYICLDSFSECMADAGWLEKVEGGIIFPHFDRHNGKSAKVRADASERKRKERKTPESEICPDLVAEMSQQLCDKSATREEKRREEEDQHPLSPETGDHDDVRQCPTGTIVNLYHEMMPNNPRIKVINASRKSSIRARWIEASKLDCAPFGYRTKSGGIDAWRQFFGVCAESKFLTGLAQPVPGKAAFIADIDFILSPAGFAKTLENKYHRDAS